MEGTCTVIFKIEIIDVSALLKPSGHILKKLLYPEKINHKSCFPLDQFLVSHFLPEHRRVFRLDNLQYRGPIIIHDT